MATKKQSGKPGDGSCLCGCGAETKPRRRFVQGHDQRARGMFQRGELKPNTPALRAFYAENRAACEPKAKPAKKAAVVPVEETPADATTDAS